MEDAFSLTFQLEIIDDRGFRASSRIDAESEPADIFLNFVHNLVEKTSSYRVMFFSLKNLPE